MKKRYYSLIGLSFVFSFISLIASIRLTPFDIKMESYLGVAVALLGICATFIVGWQIYSGMNIRDEIEKLNAINDTIQENLKKEAEKMNEMENLLLEQKRTLKKAESEREKMNLLIAEQEKIISTEKNNRRIAERNFLLLYRKAQAISYSEVHHFSAYCYFAKALGDHLNNYKNEKEQIAITMRSMRAILVRIRMTVQEMEKLKIIMKI